MSSRLPLLRVLAVLALLLVAPTVMALEVPPINGHITDPQHELSGTELEAIQAKLTKIQDETHIDVAGWLSPASEADATALGRTAYRKWNIGKDWDNGVFFMMPATGRVHVILDADRPELTPGELARVTDADRPTLSMGRRLEILSDLTLEILRPKVTHRAMPPGKANPTRGAIYGAVSVLILLLALGLTRSRRKRAMT
jgi:hypothetical protein